MRITYAVAFLALFSLVFAFTTKAQAQTRLSETQKIERLITAVEELDGARFYRNGNYYNAKQAADHLRMKLTRAGSAVKTAHDFVDKIATKSSMSGEPYKIVLKDGKELTCKEFLITKLVGMEKTSFEPQK